MCGFFGIFSNKHINLPMHIKAGILKSLRHRGPDGEGEYTNEMVTLLHTRLSIIDLSVNANQPMISKCKRYVIVYNGEVYNFQSIKKELLSLGHVFHTHSDTEVVLYAFIEWGAHAIQKFNGMFAFAILDQLNKKLFIARDRYGIKPLYYTTKDNMFIFGSEIKAILATKLLKAQIDKESLLEYLTFQNLFSQKTLFKDINLFPSGSYGWLQIENPVNLHIEKYWDYNFTDTNSGLSTNDCVDHLDFLLKNSIKSHMISDRPVGSYLSGGVDSALLSYLAAGMSKETLTTFTIGFDLNSASGIELSYDEREYAEHVSYLAKTEHYEMVLKAGDMEGSMQQLVWHLEEPRIGQCYPNFFASKLASKFVPVVLSGCGGDELFGGYPWRYMQVWDSPSYNSFIDAYYNYWQRLLNSDEICQILKSIWNEVKHVDTKEMFTNVFPHIPQKVDQPSLISSCLYFEAKTFMHSLLVVEDKLAMSHGLEMRTPYLDNELVDFALRIPIRYKLDLSKPNTRINENEAGPKVQKYYAQCKNGKIVLRAVANKYIPEKISFREKVGFSSPDNSWFRNDSLRYVYEKLGNRDNPIYDYLDFDFTQTLINQHVSGQKNRRLLLWSLLYLSEWFKTFISQESLVSQEAAFL